jgi:O-antigen/teichoic acid export membrane protein
MLKPFLLPAIKTFQFCFTFVFTIYPNILKRIKLTNVNALQLFQLFRYGSLILIGILLSKSGIGKTNIGQYETFMLIAGAFTFFWVNGFLKVMMPLSAEKNEEQQKILVFNSFLVLLFFSVLSAILVYCLSEPFSSLLLNGNKVPMPWILSGYVLFNSPALITEYIYLINNRSKNIIIYGSIIFGIQILAVGIPPYFGYGLNTILLSLFGVTIIKFIWMINVLFRYSKIRIDKPILREFIVLGTPLVISTLLGSSASYIDGFIVTSKFSPDELAIFQYGARELPLALLLANSLNMAMLPRFAQKDIESPLIEFRSEVYRLHWLLFPVSIILIFSSHWLFPVVFNPQFSESATIFNISLLLVISRVLFPQTLLNAKRMNNIQVWASFFEICVNVSSSVLLANLIGIKGVAYGTLLAYLFEKIFLMIACKKKLNISPAKYLPLKIFAISTALLTASYIIVEFVIY